MQTKHFYLLGKFWYAFHWAGLASITPYFNVYFKQRGLSDAQVGVISAVRQWVSVPSSFLWSAAADRLQRHQAILTAVLVASTASRLGLVWASGFGAFLALIIVNQFVTSPVTVMADAIVMSNCEQDGDYGKIRAWGALGWGGWSSAAGAIINRFGMVAGFVTSAIITAPCVAASWVMKFNTTKQPQQQHSTADSGQHKDAAQQQQPVHESSSKSCSSSSSSTDAKAALPEPGQPPDHKQQQQQQQQRQQQPLSFTAKLRLLLSGGEVWLFLWQSTLQGFGLGVYQSYLFIFLEEMGASSVLMGLSITVDCIAEFPAFHYQKEILRFISLDTLIHISVITYSVRLACYSLLPYWGSPWTVLPVQLLHGATYAAGWGAGTIKSKQLAQDGLQATMQGIFQAMYVGIGQGVGSLLGGLLMGRLGGQIMFAICAGAIGAGWLVSLAWDWLLRCRRAHVQQLLPPGSPRGSVAVGSRLTGSGGLANASTANSSRPPSGICADVEAGLVLVREPSDTAGPSVALVKV